MITRFILSHHLQSALRGQLISDSLQVDVCKSAKCGPVELFETDKGIRAKNEKEKKRKKSKRVTRGQKGREGFPLGWERSKKKLIRRCINSLRCSLTLFEDRGFSLSRKRYLSPCLSPSCSPRSSSISFFFLFLFHSLSFLSFFFNLFIGSNYFVTRGIKLTLIWTVCTRIYRLIRTILSSDKLS